MCDVALEQEASEQEVYSTKYASTKYSIYAPLEIHVVCQTALEQEASGLYNYIYIVYMYSNNQSYIYKYVIVTSDPCRVWNGPGAGGQHERGIII